MNKLRRSWILFKCSVSIVLQNKKLLVFPALSFIFTMMILGFAGIGFMTYRRRKVAALIEPIGAQEWLDVGLAQGGPLRFGCVGGGLGMAGQEQQHE